MAAIPDEERAAAREFPPPYVYLPVHKFGGSAGPEVELRVIEGGEEVLLAYSALDRLARCRGPHQPWILFPVDKLGELQGQTKFDKMLLDVAVPEEEWV